jgi:hypothetical protein
MTEAIVLIYQDKGSFTFTAFCCVYDGDSGKCSTIVVILKLFLTYNVAHH